MDGADKKHLRRTPTETCGAAPSVQEATRDGKKGVFIKTFGCQMNEYDTQKLYRILSHDYSVVEEPEEADLILVNTCSVRDKPQQKLYSLLGRYRNLKKKRDGLMIGVGGCVAQQEGENILNDAKVVDFVFGTHNLSLVPSLIESRQQGRGRQAAIDYRDEWEELPLGSGAVGDASAFVSISRGCNKNCAYCIVPTTRGKEVSRAKEEILREVRLLAHRGIREVVLLGQTVNSWGRDFSPRLKFSQLLREVAAVPGIERIRFTSPHPQEVREDFFRILEEIPQVCRHIHLPLQSGSDRVLKAMNRNYRMRRYYEIVDGLRSTAPDIALSTDLIVGFPGETQEDFEETLEAMRRVRFDSSYSFMFSPRPGTLAESLPEQVLLEEKKERLYQLQALQEEITSERLSGWVGRECEVLIDGPSKNDPTVYQGRNSQNYLVHLSSERTPPRTGDIFRVVVEKALRHTLEGRSVGNGAECRPAL